VVVVVVVVVVDQGRLFLLDKVKMEDVGHGKKKRMEEGKRRGMGK
jgi:hypothetical protein